MWRKAFGRQVAFKCEQLNPTGSFKDRGSALIAAFLRSRGVRTALEDSSSSAAASFSAYAAQAGIKARIYVSGAIPEQAQRRINAYGADAVQGYGSPSHAAEAARRAAENGAVYASHAYLPFNLPGYASLAYEVYDQLGQMPGSLIVPVGQGGLILGIQRGFQALQRAGSGGSTPLLVGVQARACAPLWALASYGRAGLAWVAEAQTLAEGIRVSQPVRGDAVLQAVFASRGMFVAVDEEEIPTGSVELDRLGFSIDLTSAVVWNGLAQIIGKIPEPVVVVLTGSGLKTK